MDLAELDRFMSTINMIRGCKTPDCEGKLIPVEVKSTGLGGALCITYMYICDDLLLLGVYSLYLLQNIAGIQAVSMHLFMYTIRLMFPIVHKRNV